MNEIKLHYYPNSSLKTVCKPVDLAQVTREQLLEITNKMLEVMHANQGLGISANQCGLSDRIIVIDLNGKSPIRLVNPELINTSNKTNRVQEGCLSFPTVYVDRERPESCSVNYYDPADGLMKNIDCHGLLARCVQHEIDHLNGVSMIDAISPLKRNRALEKLSKTFMRVNRSLKKQGIST